MRFIDADEFVFDDGDNKDRTPIQFPRIEQEGTNDEVMEKEEADEIFPRWREDI